MGSVETMSEMKRLQRWEIVDAGFLYSEYRELQRVEPYVGQQPDDCGDWCNAEDVAKLEDSHAELLEVLQEYAGEWEGQSDEKVRKIAESYHRDQVSARREMRRRAAIAKAVGKEAK